MLNLKSIENLSDLNNIPKLCPSITLIFLMLLGGVAERWVNIGLFFFKAWAAYKTTISKKFSLTVLFSVAYVLYLAFEEGSP